MKVPLIYPKMPNTFNCPLKRCWAFEKYDGTNLHWDWSSSQGWISFGTRRDSFPYTPDGFKEFEQAHPGLEEAVASFDPNGLLAKFMLFNFQVAKRATLFTEFLGDKSFAGQHQPGDPKRCIIIDVMVWDKLIAPEKFLDIFTPTPWHREHGYDKFPVAQLVYKGKYTGQLVEDVRLGKFSVAEGVVIKGVADKEVYMAKIKTNAYMDRLRVQFQDSWETYWEG